MTRPSGKSRGPRGPQRGRAAALTPRHVGRPEQVRYPSDFVPTWYLLVAGRAAPVDRTAERTRDGPVFAGS